MGEFSCDYWFVMVYYGLFHVISFFLKILWIQRFLKMSNDFKRWDLEVYDW